MFLSAASLGLAALLDQTAKRDLELWDLVRPSVAFILRNGRPAGQAALIDRSGWFLVHSNEITGSTLEVRAPDGRTVHLHWRATDAPSQLALLQADDWPIGLGKPVTIHSGADPVDRTPVIVTLPDGPLRGELISNKRVAVLNATRRMFPIAEVRFETTAQSVGGGLVFDASGHLVGILNATLESQEPVTSQRIAAPSSPAVQDMMKNWAKQRSYGPAEVTIGYLVDPSVLQRVVAGFLSPAHQVQHPAIGVVCKDANGTGAEVVMLRAGSPAESAGIRIGDVITQMDGRSIRDQFDFARAIDTKDVGEAVQVTIRRGATTLTIPVTVGAFKSA